MKQQSLNNQKLNLLYVENIVRLYDAGFLSAKESIMLVMKVVWRGKNGTERV